MPTLGANGVDPMSALCDDTERSAARADGSSSGTCRGRAEADKKHPAALGELVLRADGMRTLVKGAVRSAILVDRLEQVVVTVRLEGLFGQLRVEAALFAR